MDRLQNDVSLNSSNTEMQKKTDNFSAESIYSEFSYSMMSVKIINLISPDDITVTYADYHSSGIINAAVNEALSSDLFPSYKHNGFELIYVAKGSLSIRIRRTDHHFGPHSAYIVNPNCSYVFIPELGSIIYSIMISGEFLMNLYKEDHKMTFLPRSLRSFFLPFLLDRKYKNSEHIFFYTKNENFSPVETLFATVHEELYNKAPGFDYMLRALLCRIFSFLCRKSDYRMEQDSFEPKTAEELAEAVKHYLDTHRRKVLLKELEAATYYSGDYLSQIFREKMNKSIKEYNLAVCMEEAGYLLRSTVLPISKIAEQLGYQSRSQFYIVFEKYFGQSASDYRNK